jgi:hypothetical protein
MKSASPKRAGFDLGSFLSERICRRSRRFTTANMSLHWNSNYGRTGFMTKSLAHSAMSTDTALRVWQHMRCSTWIRSKSNSLWPSNWDEAMPDDIRTQPDWPVQ